MSLQCRFGKREASAGSCRLLAGKSGGPQWQCWRAHVFCRRPAVSCQSRSLRPRRSRSWVFSARDAARSHILNLCTRRANCNKCVNHARNAVLGPESILKHSEHTFAPPRVEVGVFFSFEDLESPICSPIRQLCTENSWTSQVGSGRSSGSLGGAMAPKRCL